MIEIRAQLERLCRRVNRSTLVHVALVGASGTVLVVAALVLAGMHLPPSSFRLLLWMAVAGSLVGAAVSAMVVRRAWLDPKAAAGWADRSAGLQQRLSTLASLPESRLEEGLAPILIAQVGELRAKWLPEVLIPPRFPPAGYALMTALLVLAATLWMERPPTQPAAAPVPTPGGGTQPMPQLALLASQRRGTDIAGHRSVPDSSDPRAGRDGNDLASVGGALSTDGGNPKGDAGSQRDGIAALPDRLQQAIRQALDHPEARRGADSGAGPKGQGAAEAPLERTDPRLTGGADLGRTSPSGRKSDPASPESRDAGPGKPNSETRRTGQSFEGEAPPAGGEPATKELLGKAVAEREPPKGPAFKLTLTSFMNATNGAASEPQGRPATAMEAADAAAAREFALSEDQREDDLLREAEIPMEYEGVVRRAYDRGAPPSATLGEGGR